MDTLLLSFSRAKMVEMKDKKNYWNIQKISGMDAKSRLACGASESSHLLLYVCEDTCKQQACRMHV